MEVYNFTISTAMPTRRYTGCLPMPPWPRVYRAPWLPGPGGFSPLSILSPFSLFLTFSLSHTFITYSGTRVPQSSTVV